MPSVIRLARALLRLESDLKALRLRWAAIGGLAVAARAEPRTTRDLDVAIAVAGDREAEGIVRALRSRGYYEVPKQAVMEQTDVGRLATVRLLVPGEENDGLVVDLMFASSGVEPEIVRASEIMQVMPKVAVPVVRTGHLYALKILAGRPKDQEDCQALRRRMRPEDFEEARATLELIAQRGFHRGKDLKREFERSLELSSL
ncbi:MAG: nucleotidyl transferase AbiEii/AbiGii toxin family protein [Acidobacteria bacterium]|nr:nucleotidyl transferase AbiEii/AbiGii toxin family protein [Acidobacteriota bacterium]